MSCAEDLSDVEAVLRGQTQRFEGIVARWERPLVNLAWRYVRNEAIAEEMAQEAFLLCFRKLRQWRREAEFSTWLFALAINLYRSRSRRYRPKIVDDDQLELLATTDPTEKELLREERDAVVRRAVTHLPEIYRESMIMYYFEGQDLATAARRLGLPEGTVKARLFRGRKILRERLERILR